MRKLRGLVHLHEILIPSGLEQAEEGETEEREMKDGGREGEREGAKRDVGYL